VRAREIGTVALRECYHLHPERNDPAMSGRSGIKGSESLNKAARSKRCSRILTLAPLETAERRNADRTGSDGNGRIALVDPALSTRSPFEIRVPSLNRHPRRRTRTSYAPLPTSNRRPILAADHQLLG